MPDGITTRDRYDDPYGWITGQVALLTGWPASAQRMDVEGFREFLEESAQDMSCAVESHLANPISHVTKAALTRNPQLVLHWHSECVTLHGDVELTYRRSMARAIRMDNIWRVAS